MRRQTDSVGNSRGSATLERGFSVVELLLVMFVAAILAAIAIPQYLSIVRNQRIQGDAHSLAGNISIAKMRAGANFTQARMYLDLGVNSFRVDDWDQANNCWHPDGTPVGTCANGTSGPTAVSLSIGVTPGFGGLGAPPPNTTAGLSQASACTDNTRVGTVPGTACIVFNSRGMPLNGIPGGLYITDQKTVYGVTVNASGLVQTWSSASTSGTWAHQ
jgi:prepilin-type N-terminal cleavage/methylation domain-containing protein